QFTLVDHHGEDYLGKWEAVRKAATNIRQWEGAPSCSIATPANHSWTAMPLRITVEAKAPANDPATAVKADYSVDGALHWTSLPDAVKPPYTFTLEADKVKELPWTVWLRARAVNKRGPSLWDVIEVRCSK
ncbi:MAG: hypothetical protein HY318_15670, partial [Armatimonadetes bacterium]|nr:hypothetical protein [Armatimonadota bacterium]